MKFRTIKGCYDLLQEADDGCAITQFYIRKLCNLNILKTIKTGNKLLVDFDSLINYLEKGA